LRNIIFKSLLICLALLSFLLIDPLNGQSIKLSQKVEIGVNDNLQFSIIKDLKTDKNGDVFITDLKAVKVFKFSRENKLLSQTGRIGKGPGEFLRGPSTLAVYKNDIIVIDLSTAKIAQVFNTKDLKYKTTLYNIWPAHYAALTGKYQLLLNYHNYINETYLHVYNLNSDSLFSVPLSNLTKYPRLNKFQIFFLHRSDQIILVYLYYNRIDILNENFEVIERLKIPNLPSRSQVYKPKSAKKIISHFSGKKAKIIERASYFPEYTIFKGSAIGPKGNVFLQTGTVKEIGQRLTYVINQKGNIISTFKLPFNEELVDIDKQGYLYTIKDSRNKAYQYKINYSGFSDTARF